MLFRSKTPAQPRSTFLFGAELCQETKEAFLKLLDLLPFFLKKFENVVGSAEMSGANDYGCRDTGLDRRVNFLDPAQVSIIEQSEFGAEILLPLAFLLGRDRAEISVFPAFS